jgi:hypothetical protein
MARFRDRRTDANERGDSESAVYYDVLTEAFSEIVANLETAFKSLSGNIRLDCKVFEA